MGDLRCPKEERSAIAAEIVRQRQCCCRPGLSRGLRAHGLRGADGADRIASAVKVLVDMWWVMVLIAFFVRMSIAVVENMHKRHRLFITDGKTSPETLLAMSICSRLKSRVDEYARRYQPRKRAHTDKDASHASLDPGKFAMVRRALNAREVFSARRLAEFKASGRHANPCDPSVKV